MVHMVRRMSTMGLNIIMKILQNVAFSCLVSSIWYVTYLSYSLAHCVKPPHRVSCYDTPDVTTVHRPEVAGYEKDYGTVFSLFSSVVCVHSALCRQAAATAGRAAHGRQELQPGRPGRRKHVQTKTSMAKGEINIFIEYYMNKNIEITRYSVSVWVFENR